MKRNIHHLILSGTIYYNKILSFRWCDTVTHLGCSGAEAGVEMSSRSKQVLRFGWRTGESRMKSFESEAVALNQHLIKTKRGYI